MAGHVLFSSISSSSFDTYLVYCIIGLLILMALIGLCILLTTSCCCCYCCLTSLSSCYPSRRHLTYKLNDKKRSNDSDPSKTDQPKRLTFIRRQSSSLTDFNQLYDSCPHLINSKVVTNKSTNMDTSCTTIDTVVTPASPCSSFRSVPQSGTLNRENKFSIVQNDLINPSLTPPSIPEIITLDKTTTAPVATNKSTGVRPFSYIKNINDRTQILRRFAQHDQSKLSKSTVPIQISRISSPHNDIHCQTYLNSANIYETVPTTLNSNQTSTKEVPVPIYESEWTHNLKQLMMATSAKDNRSVSVIELPPAPPDLLPTTNPSIDYFQQHNPYDKFLASRTPTSDSMRRATMLKQINNDAAFLY